MRALFNDTRLLGGRAIVLGFRNPATLFGAVLFPLLFLGLFNIVTRKIMLARGFDYQQLLPSTVVVQAMMFAGMASASYVATDRLSGLMSRLRSLPIHRLAPLTGRAVGDLTRSTVSILTILAVGLATGMRIHTGLVGFISYVLFGLLFALTCSLGFGLIGYRAQSPQAAVSLASLPYLPLLMISTGFAPAGDFPEWLQPIVRWQPVSAAIDALRAIASGNDVTEHVARGAAWCIGLIVLFGLLGTRSIRRSA